jgi:diaminopimelate epimerase
MQRIHFHKFHGAGNDFILLSHTASSEAPDEETIRNMCRRHFGVGADGLIILQASSVADFEMKYYNADGREGSMCGNGGRCAALYAYEQGMCSEEMSFMAFDGLHRAKIINSGDKPLVTLQMSNVTRIHNGGDHFFIDTGSPHYVAFKQNIETIDMDKEARPLRHHYRKGGTNVNFIEKKGAHYHIRTFERGVEQETLACGTGITAAAIAVAETHSPGTSTIPVKAKGGTLEVSLTKSSGSYENIWLKGPAVNVFEGTIKFI